MSDPVHDAKRLEELRALPLDRKIQISQTRIIEWYNHYNGNVVVSYSGGKDSTALLHLVRIRGENALERGRAALGAHVEGAVAGV